MIEPVRITENEVLLLDQRLLPREEQWASCCDAREVAEAIQAMVVRGAPAIGVAAAGALALAARGAASSNVEQFRDELDAAETRLIAARPTAVNLAWGVRRVRSAIERALDDGAAPPVAAERAFAEAQAIRDEDIAANQALGRHGSLFVPDGARVLTHCNAGALATAGYGTALGVIRAAVEEGKKVIVYADETRPVLQGARLTTWELQQDGIPVVLITDNMAGALMARGEIDLVIVGADRIAINGDVANKIGTYTVAVLARRHGIPFYVAAPTSTLDPDCPGGEAIPIEERSPEEVTHIAGVRVAADGVEVRNQAFDVTPAELVTAIVTEKGVHRSPFGRSLRAALGLAEESPAPAPSVAAAADASAPIEDATNPEEDLF